MSARKPMPRDIELIPAARKMIVQHLSTTPVGLPPLADEHYKVAMDAVVNAMTAAFVAGYKEGWRRQ